MLKISIVILIDAKNKCITQKHKTLHENENPLIFKSGVFKRLSQFYLVVNGFFVQEFL